MHDPTLPLMDDLKARACDAVDRRGETLVGLSHAVHANPELAFEEFASSRLIAEAAEQAGLSVTRAAYGLETALASEFGRGVGAVTVGILSEYDALPGIGHACGHNIIAAAGLGAALALHDLGADLPGRVRWVGTPAEERGCGKELMARAGAFEGLDAAMMVHPAGIDAKGVRALCIADAEVVFRGRAAHAAVNPHGGLNALDAAVAAYQAVAALRQHLAPGDLLNGVMIQGGGAPNIIPDRAVLAYFVRAPDGRRLRALKARFEAAMRAGAIGAGCEVEIGWSNADYLDFKSNSPLADAYEANAARLGRSFYPVERLPAGGTDMGNVSHRVPSLHPLIAAAPPEIMIHDRAFTAWAGSPMGDAAVLDGAKALAMTALDLFIDVAFRARVAAAFSEGAAESAEAVAAAWRDSDHVRHAGAGCC